MLAKTRTNKVKVNKKKMKNKYIVPRQRYTNLSFEGILAASEGIDKNGDKFADPSCGQDVKAQESLGRTNLWDNEW